MIIPAIDILEGRVARLTEGRYDSVEFYETTPAAQAAYFYERGYRRLHLVDLDGARTGTARHLDVLREVTSAVPGVEVEWGGGITSTAVLESVFEAGAKHAVIGSIAAVNPALFIEWLERFGSERMVLGADVRQGHVSVSGWTTDLDLTIDRLLEMFEPHGLTQAIVTDISRDGTLTGPSFPLYLDLQARHPQVCFTVSGGVGSRLDIEVAHYLGFRRVIVGKAFYEGKVEL